MEDRLTTTNGFAAGEWRDSMLVCIYSDIDDIPDSDSDLDTEVDEGRDDSSDKDDGVDRCPTPCSHPPIRTLLPSPKCINGLFLSAASMDRCGLYKRDEKAGVRGRVLGLGLSSFGLRELTILNRG